MSYFDGACLSGKRCLSLSYNIRMLPIVNKGLKQVNGFKVGWASGFGDVMLFNLVKEEQFRQGGSHFTIILRYLSVSISAHLSAFG